MGANGPFSQDDTETDPLYLEESWTLGSDAAAARWRERQTGHKDCERLSRALRDLNNLGTLFSVQQRVLYAERFPSAPAAPDAKTAGWLPAFSEEDATSAENQAPQQCA